jgi:hypothetical protein
MQAATSFNSSPLVIEESKDKTAVYGRAPSTTLSSRTRRSRVAADAPLPRLYSSPDLGETNVSDVISELALLADPCSTLRLNRLMSDGLELSPPEALVATLVGANMSMGEILSMSPFREDETLQFLADLVTNGVVSVKAHG